MRAAHGYLRTLGLALLLLLPIMSAAAEGTDVEELKAAFLFNFAKFAHWPEESFESLNSPFRLCIVGAGEVQQYLQAAVSRKLHNHVFTLDERRPGESLSGCHLAYFEQNVALPAARVLDELQRRHVLVVTNAPTYGTIQFVLHQSKLAFVVDLNLANKSDVVLSSQVLKLAAQVIGESK